MRRDEVEEEKESIVSVTLQRGNGPIGQVRRFINFVPVVVDVVESMVQAKGMAFELESVVADGRDVITGFPENHRK